MPLCAYSTHPHQIPHCLYTRFTLLYPVAYTNIPNNFTEILYDSFLSSCKQNFPLLKECIALLCGGLILDVSANTPVVLDENKTNEVFEAVIEVLKTGAMSVAHQERYADDRVYGTLFLGLLELFGEAIRIRVVDKTFADDLRKLGLPRTALTTMTTLLATHRQDLVAAARAERMVLPSLRGLDWRVDVAITTTQLNKVFKPSVLLQLTTSDDRIETFECSVDKFHQLRYSVARMLAAMQNIEQHPTLMRLVD
jgi:hypothetical protein